MEKRTSVLVILEIHFNLDQTLNFSKIYAERVRCPKQTKSPKYRIYKDETPQNAVLDHHTYYSTDQSSLAAGTGKPQDEEMPCNAFVWAIQPKFQKLWNFGAAQGLLLQDRTLLLDNSIGFRVIQCKTRTSGV